MRLLRPRIAKELGFGQGYQNKKFNGQDFPNWKYILNLGLGGSLIFLIFPKIIFYCFKKKIINRAPVNLKQLAPIPWNDW